MHGFNDDYGIVKYYQHRQSLYPSHWQGVGTHPSPKSPHQRSSAPIHSNILRIILTATIVSLVCASIVMLVSSL